jgi:hypothetical protein
MTSVIITGLQVGSAALIAKPAAELVRDFLGKILAPTGDAAGQALAHPIVEWQRRRVERAAKLVENSAEIVAERNEEPKAVPGRLFFPIIERASVEEDANLTRRWAALLAHASISPDDTPPAFVGILSELSPREARLLSHVHEVRSEIARRVSNRKAQTAVSPEPYDEEQLNQMLGERLTLNTLAEELGYEGSLDMSLVVDLANLRRLSLLKPGGSASYLGLTVFGNAFIKACSSSVTPLSHSGS